MANVFVSKQTMTDIADAIRDKLRVTAKYKPSEMATAISQIEKQEITSKKIGQMYTTFTDSSFDIVAGDLGYNKTLTDEAFYYTSSTYYKNILDNINSITFPNNGVATSTNMKNMFRGLPNTKSIALNGLDISNTTDMSYLCNGCTSLTNYSFGTVLNNVVDDLSYAFKNCKVLSSIDLGNLNIGNVSKLSQTFYNCYLLTDINFLNNKTYSNIEALDSTFYNCIGLTDITLKNITINSSSSSFTLLRMFYGTSNLNSVVLNNINITNTSAKLSNFNSIFSNSGISSITLNNVNIAASISNNGTSYDNNLTTINLNNIQCTNSDNVLQYWFNGRSKLQSFDFGSAQLAFTNIKYILSNCSLLNTIYLNTAKLTGNAQNMFDSCKAPIIDFGTSKLQLSSTNLMFNSETYITDIDFTTIDSTSYSNSINSMFRDCTALVSVDFGNLSLANVTSMSYLFYNCKALTTINLGNMPLANIANMGYAFYNCQKLADISFLNDKTYNNLRTISYAFYGCNALTDIVLENITLNTSNPISFDHIFLNCPLLKTVKFKNISIPNSSSITLLDNMFGNSSSSGTTIVESIIIEDVDIAGKITSSSNSHSTNNKLVNMNLGNLIMSNSSNDLHYFFYDYDMLETFNFGSSKLTFSDIHGFFYDCAKLATVNFDTCTLTGNAYDMFNNAEALTTIDFGTSTLLLSSATYMFDNCPLLTSVDFSTINSSSYANNITYMFYKDKALTSVNFGNLDISNVTSLNYLFYDCTGLTTINNINWGNIDLNKIVSTNYTFSNCTGLTNISLSDIAFGTSSSITFTDMFANCTNLETCIYNNISILNSSAIKCPGELFAGKVITLNDVVITGKITNLGDNKIATTVNLGNTIISNSNNDLSGMFANNSSYGLYPLLETVNLGSATINCNYIHHMFYNSPITSINFGTCSITAKYSNSMFERCTSLTTVNMSRATLDLGSVYGMFKNCTSLYSVVFPPSFTSIIHNLVSSVKAQGLFYGCTALQSVTFLSTTPPVFKDVSYAQYLFSSTANGYNDGMTIYVPSGCGEAYKSADGWSNFADIIEELS